MTDISNVIRWNANFVRGLAQSVLERARVIRTSLTPFVKEEAVAATGRKTPRKRTLRKPAKRAARKARPSRKSNAG